MKSVVEVELDPSNWVTIFLHIMVSNQIVAVLIIKQLYLGVSSGYVCR